MRASLILWLLLAGWACEESLDGSWQLRLPAGQTFEVGQETAAERYTLGDHLDADSITQPHFRKPLSESILDRPDVVMDELQAGAQRGHLVWVRSGKPGAQLLHDGQVVARVGESLESWQSRLGAPFLRLGHVSNGHSISLFRAPMADIGVEESEQRVVRVILMEPGQLRTHLLRQGLFRESTSSERPIVMMLKHLFREPRSEWQQILQSYRWLLDATFFIELEQRLAWDEREGNWEDALRFASAGDHALLVLGQKPRYCAGLYLILEEREVALLYFGFEDELVRLGAEAPWRYSRVARLVTSPSRSQAALRRAEVEWRRGNLEVALRNFRAAAVEDPNSVAAHLRLSQFYLGTGRANQELRSWSDRPPLSAPERSLAPPGDLSRTPLS